MTKEYLNLTQNLLPKRDSKNNYLKLRLVYPNVYACTKLTYGSVI